MPALIRALSMAVCANDITLFHLMQDSFHRHPIHAVQLVLLLDAFTMIKIHHVVRILNAAISARAGLLLANKISALDVRTRVPSKILTFVLLVMIARKDFAAVATVRVPNSGCAIFEIVFSYRLNRLTLGADLNVGGLRIFLLT